MDIVLIWLVLAPLVGILAHSRGRSGFGFFLLSVLLSPLIGLIIVLVIRNPREEERKEQLRREEDERHLESIQAIASQMQRPGASVQSAEAMHAPVESVVTQQAGREGAGLRKCPYCAELIKSEAIKCKHCLSEVRPLIQPEPLVPTTLTSHGQTTELPLQKSASKKAGLVIFTVLISVFGIVVVSVYQTKTVSGPIQANGSSQGAILLQGEHPVQRNAQALANVVDPRATSDVASSESKEVGSNAEPRTEDSMVKEMAQAAKAAVSTLQKDGLYGVINEIDKCYNTVKSSNEQNFKCVYLDVAGRYLDKAGVEVLHASPKPFFQDDQFGSRVGAVLQRANMDELTAARYLVGLETIMKKLVDTEVDEREHASLPSPN